MTAVFGAGFAAGQARQTDGGRAKNQFAQPKTVLQVSMIKWKKDASDADKQKVLDGIKEMAGQIRGIKTVWLKVDRMQPRDYDTAFAIEFASREAANDYADNPLHEKWSKAYVAIRDTSISPQLTNP
jgi:hypothetical protein